jgi:hypothetical protein
MNNVDVVSFGVVRGEVDDPVSFGLKVTEAARLLLPKSMNEDVKSLIGIQSISTFIPRNPIRTKVNWLQTFPDVDSI